MLALFHSLQEFTDKALYHFVAEFDCVLLQLFDILNTI